MRAVGYNHCRGRKWMRREARDNVTADGAMRLQYSSGKANWKRIEYDNVRRDIRIAQENRGQPGRYVETKNGGTITFSTGDTLTFHDIE